MYIGIIYMYVCLCIVYEVSCCTRQCIVITVYYTYNLCTCMLYVILYRTNSGGGDSSGGNTTDIDTHAADILNSLAAFG